MISSKYGRDILKFVRGFWLKFNSVPAIKSRITAQYICSFLVLYCFLPAVVTVILLIAKVPVSKFHFPVSMLIIMLSIGIGAKVTNTYRQVLVALIISTILIICSFYFSMIGFDTSFDGRTYHFIAQTDLINGWNPLYSPITKMGSITTYPKISWFSGAVIYSFFNNYEFTKSLNLIWILIVFFASYAVLGETGQFSKGKVIIGSILIALNPISLYQSLSHYVDGQLYSSLALLALSLYLAILRPGKVSYLWIFISFVYCANIKFTGLVFSSLFLIYFFIVTLLIKNKARSIFFLKYFAFVGITAILLIGYNPYITNMINYGNPFYPFGENLIGHRALQNPATGITGVLAQGWTHEMPEDFIEKNRIERFFRASFSKTQTGIEKSQLKIPFTFTPEELDSYYYADLRQGGFGPLFGGILILSAISLITIILKDVKLSWTILPIIFTLFTTIFMIADNWWARYIPHAWLIPLIIMFGHWKLINYSSFSKIIRAALIVSVALNVGLVTYSYLSIKVNEGNTINKIFDNAISSRRPVEIVEMKGVNELFVNHTMSVLDTYHVPYIVVSPSFTCKEVALITPTTYCYKE